MLCVFSTLLPLQCFEGNTFSFWMNNVYFSVTASVVYRSEFLATNPEVLVRFLSLPDFLRSSGSGRASRVQLRSYFEEVVEVSVWKTESTALGIRRADHTTPSIRKSWH
jgi:hypothetical protein